MNRMPAASDDPELAQLTEHFAHWREDRATPKERIVALGMTCPLQCARS